MARRAVKSYAADIVRDLRRDQDRRTTQYGVDFIDLAEVLHVRPNLVITPHHDTIEYTDDDIIFQINPETLEVGDIVVMARDPGGTPIVIGTADSSGGVVANDVDDLKVLVNELQASLTTLDFLPLSGGTLTGNLIMSSGTFITLPSAPTTATDAVNKAYVDGWVNTLKNYIDDLFVLCCDKAIPTITIDATDSTPCYKARPEDQVILVDTSLGPVTICLPANHLDDKFYEIKDISGMASINNITVESEDLDLIDGALVRVIDIDFLAITAVSDGTDWYII